MQEPSFVAHLPLSAFDAPPPTVLNVERIPADIHEAMRPGWLSGHHGQRDLTVTVHRNARIALEGLVFRADGTLVEDTITQHSGAEIAGVSPLRTPDARIRGLSLLMRKRGEQNFGHWLLEILPKYHLARIYLKPDHLIVPHAPGALDRVIRRSLAMLDPHHPPLLPVNSAAVVEFEELAVVSGLTHHGWYMSQLAVAHAEQMRRPFLGRRRRKLLVSRQTAPRRRVHNWDELKDFGTSRGFEVIEPGRLTLDEQIEAFANAETIVGVMGAEMSNLLFAPPGAKVVVLAPENMPDTFYYFISTHRRSRYVEIRCERDAPDQTWDNNLIVDCARLEQALAI